MKKVSKALSLIMVLTICFASFCSPAFAAALTPEEEALKLQSIISEVDQFVYIDESNLFALSSLPARYGNLYSEIKKAIDANNSFIQHIMTLDSVTVNKDDKSFSCGFLVDPDGSGMDRVYWWGNRQRLSEKACEKIFKDFEEFKKLNPVSGYYESFFSKLKTIHELNKSGVQYDLCNFSISSNDVQLCFLMDTSKAWN